MHIDASTTDDLQGWRMSVLSLRGMKKTLFHFDRAERVEKSLFKVSYLLKIVDCSFTQICSMTLPGESLETFAWNRDLIKPIKANSGLKIRSSSLKILKVMQ